MCFTDKMVKLNLKSLFKLKGKNHLKLGSYNYIFAFLALLMLAIVSVLVIWSVVFLVSELTKSFDDSEVPVPTKKFDIKGFEELDLIR